MSSRVRQLSFIPRQSLEHGGDTRAGKRKIARPFDPSRSLHLVLKSRRARGEWSMLHGRHRDKIEALTRGMAQKFSVTIDRRGYANVGTHLHLLVRAPGRREMRSFIRALSGAIAMLVTGARKGCALIGLFWDRLPYSRIVSWGRDLEAVRKYIVKNLFEAAGLWVAKDRAADLISLDCREGLKRSEMFEQGEVSLREGEFWASDEFWRAMAKCSGWAKLRRGEIRVPRGF